MKKSKKVTLMTKVMLMTRLKNAKTATLISIASIAGSVVVGSSALAAEHVDYYRYGDHMWGMGSGWMFGGFAMMFVFWAVVIALIVWAVRWTSDGKTGSKKNHALEILKERLARGEIDPAEFEERRKVLE